MPRILVFFPFCFTAATQGNEKRALQFVQLLAERGDVVDILSYEGMGGRFWGQQPRLENAGSIELVKLGGLLKCGVRRLIRLFGRPVWGASQMDFELRGRFKKLLQRQSYSHVVVNYADYAYLLELVSDKKTVKVCDTHDIWTVRERFGASPWVMGLALAWEIKTLSRADVVVAVSPSERDVFSALLPSRIELIPPWFEPINLSQGEKEFDLLFVGSANRLNIRGLRWFLDEVFPYFPSLKMAVCGKICSRMSTELAHFPSITAFGFVSDLDGIYAKAKVAVCPMIGGAGVKVKVIEAISRGIPVIGSRIIAAGLLPGYEKACFLADDSESFRHLLSRVDEIASANNAYEYSHSYSKRSAEELMNRLFG